MLYVIHCIDRSGALSTRNELYPDHREYLSKNELVEILVSGPIINEYDNTPIGSLFIIEAKNKLLAEKFHKNDPFYKNEVWVQSSVLAFDRKR